MKYVTILFWNRYTSYNPYSIAMLATKRIPVTETVWTELSELKSAGQTYSQLLEEMIEDK